ncbi:hypothetical protein PHJA_001370300 [Phtheirospermum japonicum]|uniref:FAF domain-containing protein n=1 Tax=Phtheirospermum japonicum TaxID=374723 RepID=A0A830C257_9LAMI|nr:hypothetical protein PHJA_001370300 [Phtheirospermum japonicum]
MAVCGSLERIFDNPLPENQTFLESLSPWKHKPDSSSSSSFTEIFGELHFKEFNNPSLPTESPPQSPPARPGTDATDGSPIKSPSASNYSQKKQYKHSGSFSSVNSESLSLCTEGLGFESFDDAEDRNTNHVCNGEVRNVRIAEKNHHHRMDQFNKRSRICRSEFPPPISCIGRSGKPWVCFRSYRQDGRFILKEIRIPTQEFLHACREDGRLRLQFISSDDEIFEDDDDDEEEIGDNLILNR